MFWKKKVKVLGEDLLNCPRCHIHMEKLKKGDVIIDVCKKCNGMWLDDGEIDKLNKMEEKP